MIFIHVLLKCFTFQGSTSSLSDSCSSCHSSEFPSGNSSDSGLNHEPFYLHPPSPVIKTDNKNNDPPTHNDSNNNNSNNNHHRRNSLKENGSNNDTKEVTEGKVAFNPLEELKEASEKYKNKTNSLRKSKSCPPNALEPFYLHKPEEKNYHRVQELFEEKTAVPNENSPPKLPGEGKIKTPPSRKSPEKSPREIKKEDGTLNEQNTHHNTKAKLIEKKSSPVGQGKVFIVTFEYKKKY